MEHQHDHGSSTQREHKSTNHQLQSSSKHKKDEYQPDIIGQCGKYICSEIFPTNHYSIFKTPKKGERGVFITNKYNPCATHEPLLDRYCELGHCGK